MSKFKEIIEKLKEVGMSVNDFAYDEIPIGNDYSEEALKAQEIKDEWVKANLNPGYNKEGYKEWQESYQKLPSKYDVAQKEWLEKNDIPHWIEVDSHGGENEGSNWYSIKYFPSIDLYVKVSGWYQSHYGTDFEGWESAVTEVIPKEKTITVYE